MADIFVKQYDEQQKPRNRFILTALIVLAITAAIVGLCLWADTRSAEPATEKPVAEQPPAQPAKVSAPAAAPAPVVPVPAVTDKAQQLFTRAQSLAAAGSLEQARDLLGEVMATTADESLKNNALRVQGRINTQLLFSSTPSPEKKSYVVQPGDLLEKIAKQNKTTVDLIQKMNKVDGSRIYPGQRLLVPAAPFVIQVNKRTKTMDLVMNGKLFKRYSVTLGVNGKTPAGTFRTVVHQTNPDWTPPGGGIIKFGDPRNLLGTRWISIQDSTRPEIKGFGIHGTSNPESIGTETSNGCIRMVNEEVEELYLMIPRGTEVIISE